MTFSRRLLLSAALLGLFATTTQAQTAPAVIRIAAPEQGSGTNSFPGATPLAVAKARGLIEEEFKKDGIKIEWTLFRGAGPAINEALAARQLDVVYLGDLASVIGRARGLQTKLILPLVRGSNSYLAVAPGSDIKSFADLKGRKVSVLKGTAYQRPFDQFLADVGLTEKDVKLLNLDWPASKAAVVNKDIDATFGGVDLNLLADKGVSLPVNTRGKGPAYTIQSSVLATEDFTSKYPAHTTRLVAAILRASQWASEEANREPLIQLWQQSSGTPAAVFRAEYQDSSLKNRNSPLFDDFTRTAYKGVVADAQRLGLIKQGFDVEAWLEPRFVNEALRQLKLEGFWQPADKDGKVRGGA
ncbi:ABC transporter substrate-binding protein [Roseateles cavernae]|uniref:ABC transporter substrate-binding protein n=1 Tax=Roseateles cavernae TaxID=3153578 RepID=UPI0032E40260